MTRKLHINEECFVNLIAISLMGITPLIMIPGAFDGYYTPKLYFVYFISTISLIYLYIKRDTLSFDWVDKLLGLFIGILFISSLMGIDIHNSFIGNMTDREPFFLYLCYYIIFLFISKKFKISKRFFDILFICATIVSVYALLQFFGINPIKLDKVRTATMRFQAISTLGYRNAVGAYISLFLPIAISLFIYKSEKRYLIITAILFATLVSSLTRSSWISLAVYITILFIISIRNKKRFINWMAVIVVMIGIFFGLNYLRSGQLNNRLLSISNDATSLQQSGNEMAGSGRIYIWKNGLNLLWDKPLLGYGMDNFGVAFMDKYADDNNFMVKKLGGTITKAHNEYLQILVSSGIFAEIIYLMILFIIVIKVAIKGIKEQNNYLIAIGLSIISYNIQAFFNISIVSVSPVFWTVIAIGYGLVKQGECKAISRQSLIIRYIEKFELIRIFSFLIMGLIPIVILPGLKDRFYEPKIILVYLVVMLAMLFIYDRRIWSKNTLIDYLIVFFILWILISTLFSVDIATSIVGRPSRREGFLAIFFYCLIFLIMYKHFKFSDNVFKIINIFICTISIYGVAQYLGYDFIHADYIRKDWHNIAYSTIGNRDFFAILMTLYLPVNICFYLSEGKKKYLFISIIIFAGLIASVARSNWISFIVYGMIIFFYCLRKRKYLIRCLICLVLFIITFISINLLTDSSISSRVDSIGLDAKKIASQNNDTVGSSRMYIWKRGITFIPEHPMFGSGPDTFGIVFLQKYSDELEYMQNITGGIVDKAHNEYLQLTVTSGIPALLIYLALVAFICLKLIKRISRAEETYQILYLGLLMAIIGYLVQAFFNISVVSVAPVFWAMLGIGANIGDRSVSEVE
ncbi:O-antigen ligase family protein [Clostridium sp. C8-1-8]|uniref:O-antigen ligase family protein n=1 Tax=Clostridium sp. C8-1-8 TaxID=2698831 RepID=UPI001371ADD5|nr:O-antigen ligase family protein [Clostridium sp. C8-1-8]